MNWPDELIEELVRRAENTTDAVPYGHPEWRDYVTIAAIWQPVPTSKSGEDPVLSQLTKREWCFVAEALSIDTAPSIRAKVGQFHLTPPCVIEAMLSDRSTEIRAAIASNPSVSSAQQLALAKDKSAEVRLMLASNPIISVETQATLSRDRDRKVRSHLAKNGGLDSSLLRLLFNRDCPLAPRLLS